MFRVRGMVAALVWGVLPAVAGAAPPADRAFEDWTLRCAATCQMFQTASLAGGAGSTLLLSIAPGEDGASQYGVLSAPLGVYLVPGVEIRVDDRRPFKVLYEICDGAACHAGFRLSGEVLAAFRQGLEAKVRVWVSRDQAAEFTLSLRGFSKGYVALLDGPAGTEAGQ